MDNGGHGKAKEMVNRSHPLDISSCQIVIDRDEVNPLPFQGVQIKGKRSHQGFSLTGFHLGDLPLMEHQSADHLDIEVAELYSPLGRLPHGGEGLRDEVIQTSPIGKPFFELDGLGSKLCIGKLLALGLQGVYLLNEGPDAF